jgi:predicted DNA-binding transcriptional regulator YafY
VSDIFGDRNGLSIKIPPGIGKVDKETTRKDLGLSPGKVFHIQYKDSKGDISERDIEIQKIAEVKDKTYIYGYCHLHKATRSFLASRILSMSYYGRPIKDFHDLFQMDFSTPEDFIEKLVKEALKIEEPST